MAALRWHAAARGDRARARLASGDPAARRAVRVGRCADARRAPGPRAAAPSSTRSGASRSSTSRTTSTRPSTSPTVCSCSAARPGRIVASVDVALPRPREQTETRSSPQFLALRNELHGLIASASVGTIEHGMMSRALLVGVCSLALLAPVAGAGDTQLTKIKVAFLAAEPAALVTYAKHRGMLTKQGIDAEMVPRTDPQVLLAALLSGDVQFSGAHAGAAALLKSRGAPIKVVAAGALYEPKNPTSALVAAKGKTVRRPRDLVGKTILIDGPNTIAHIGVLKWLKRGGVSKDDVKISYVPFPEMLASLSKATVDAAFMPEPFLTQAAQQGLEDRRLPVRRRVLEAVLADVLDRTSRRRREPRRPLPERAPERRRLGEPGPRTTPRARRSSRSTSRSTRR